MQQPELPLDDAPTPKSTARINGALRVVADGAKPLSQRQRQFNRLVSRIESLRTEIAKKRTQLDALLAEYVARIHPLRTEESRVRRGLIRGLAVVWRKPTGLGKRQRTNLRDLLRVQFSLLDDQEFGPEDGDLVILFDELERDAEREAEALRKQHEKLFGEDGEDAEAEGSKEDAEEEPELNEEEILRAFAQRFANQDGADDVHSTAEGPPPPRRQTAAQKRRAQREAELAAARKHGISTIYKQLAKVLHPDLERDPSRRAEKVRLMQQLTEAHRTGDLHTLLRLELEFIHGEERRSRELGDEKLALYCDLLKEQVAELEEEKSRLTFDPQYAVVVRRFWPYPPQPSDLRDWAKEIRAQIDSMAASQARLDGAEAKAEIREALKAFAAHQRRARRSVFFDVPF